MALAALTIIVACMVYDPTMKLLLYAAVPENYQTWPLFGICLVEEIHLLVVFAGLAVPTLQVQIIAFQDVHKPLQDLVESKAET